MPVGVPKVFYALPDEEEADWIDLYHCLYQERLIVICGDLNDEAVNQIVSVLIYLSTRDDSKEFFIYINSPGGSVTSGIAIYDAMRFNNTPVNTIAVGISASMASFILAGGDIGKRLAFPHSRIMIHQPEGGSEGQSSEIVHEAQEVVRIRRQVARIYAQRTGQPLDTIARDMDRDQFMSAREAKAYGLVDLVAAEK